MMKLKLMSGAACAAALIAFAPVAPMVAQEPAAYAAAKERVPDAAAIDIAETQLKAAMSQVPRSTRATESSLEPLAALLPEEMTLTWDSAGLDADGVFVVEGLTLGVAEMPLALRIDRLTGWGFDTEALTARLEGQRLDETMAIADKLELSGIRVVGVMETITALAGEEADMAKFNALSFGIDRFVINDFQLNPWELNLIEADGGSMAEFVSLLQGYAAFERSWSSSFTGVEGVSFVVDIEVPASDYSYYDYEDAEDDVEEEEETEYYRQAMSFDIGFAGASGQSGWDVDVGMISDVTYDLDMTDDETGAPVRMSGTFDRTSYYDLRLNKALGYLARGEMPSTDEVDLMSLGVWVGEGSNVTMGGQPYISTTRSVLLADDWHWLIPENITSWDEGSTININTLLGYVNEIMLSEGASPDDLVPEEVFGVLTDTGFSPLTLTSASHLGWDAGSGDTDMLMDLTLGGLFDFDFRLDGTLVDYETGVASFQPDENGDVDPSEEWIDSTVLNSGLIQLSDLGGLDAVSSLIIGLAGVFPDMDEARISELSPAALRASAAGFIVFGSTQVREEFPEATDYAMALSNWLNQGGTITLRMAPEGSVRVADLAVAMDDGDFETPSELIEFLGISLVHTPPAAE